MHDRRKLSSEEVARGLSGLRGWSVVNGKLHKEFMFTDFVRAFGFMSQVALIAESMDHHPDWSNVYNRVNIDLVTHDLGGISTLDIEFASKVEKLLPS
jgi:4a-hydroxytetrahydrobiopterin dehydratase